jgi:hypothetical protein
MNGPTALLELRDHRIAAPWLFTSVRPDISGGRTDAKDIRALEIPDGVTAVRISGLDQAGFEELVARHGSRLVALHLWKSPRIADLSPLEDIAGLRLVAIFWNQRASRLWDLNRTPNLQGLSLEDFTRLHDLADLAAGASLGELAVESALSSAWKVDTLEPLGALSELRSLDLGVRRIGDGRIEPLGGLVGLESLGFPSNLFTTAQVAWLRARLPEGLASPSLDAVRTFDPPLAGPRGPVDTLPAGKRKPFLSSDRDHVRIARLVAQFDALVERYRSDPSLPPA